MGKYIFIKGWEIYDALNGMWKVWKEKMPFSCSFRIPQKGNVIPQVYQQAFTSFFLIIIIELWPFGEA